MKRVLVVDDKEENRYMLNALLTGHGFAVDTARHGAEALVKARQSPPDLVISDLLMPVMDGYTLLRNWKADARLNRAPFVVYTATYTEPADEQLALDLGADAFVIKPTETEKLIALVRSVVLRVTPPQPKPPATNDVELMREYSQTLIRKLEHKSIELEAANRQLQADIGARAIAEVALRESEERFRQIAENIDDVFWLSEPHTQIVFYVSPAYEQVFGRSREHLYATPSSWVESIHEDDRARVQRTLPQQAVGNWSERYRIIRNDGAVRWVRARAYPVRNASGEVYRIVGVTRDITEYQNLEDQFRQAQKMEAVGRLAGGIAHDFNNLLSVILSYTSLVLLDLAPDAAIRSDIAEVHLAGRRAAELTKQLLAFSRQQVLDPQVVNLETVVLAMEKMLHRLLGEDVELVLTPGSAGAKVYADPSQIEQIVMNLAVNARDAMPRGGRLTVSLRTVEIDASDAARRRSWVAGPYVLLSVTDTGTGIDAATIERIFEPFFTTKEPGKGTGLGLSTVFGIVNQSRGHIEVVSALGQGTSFHVYFPRTERPAETLAPIAAPPVTLNGSECVLLVEDDAQVREATCAVLERHGYRVLSAAHGEEAFALAQTAPEIELLLTDVVMPRMGGPELAQKLVLLRPKLKVLYLSGDADGAIDLQGVEGLAIELLAKPIVPEVLLRKVREVLSQH